VQSCQVERQERQHGFCVASAAQPPRKRSSSALVKEMTTNFRLSCVALVRPGDCKLELHGGGRVAGCVCLRADDV
jgi:hypothetical protein